MKKVISSLLLLASFSLVSAAVNPPDLEMGMQNDEVYSLQNFLVSEKLLSLPFGATGYFGASTRDAVNEFKSKKGLSQNGVVDCATRAYIPTIAVCSGITVKAEGTTAPASLTSAQQWYQQNCLPEPVGLELGRITPMFYTPSGMGGTELAQISKPFNATVSGVSSTTIGAKITASDSDIDIQPAACKEGMASGGMTCTVTASGQPRDLYLRIFNGRPGIKPLCQKVTLYRAPITYNVGISIDKTEFGSGEAFKVTLSGISRDNAKEINGPIAFARSNAPVSSCEFAQNIGKPGTVCQGDGVLTCGMLPGTGAAEYLCATTLLDVSGSFRNPNNTSDVVYTALFPTRHSLFDKYVPAGQPKDIKLFKQGTNNNGGMTSYGGCSAGEGVDPRYPERGCTRCQNIINTYRSHISTCGVTGQDTFTWRYARQVNIGDQYATCAPKKEGDTCTDSQAHCIDGQRLLACTNTNVTVTQSQYHGKVLDAVTNQPLAGVTVESWSVVANMMGYNPNFSCPKTTTDTSGEYRFSQADSQSICLYSSGYVKFKKAGYTETSIPTGNEFDKLIPTFKLQPTNGGTPPPPNNPGDATALSLSPSSATLTRSSGASVVFTLANGKIARDANNLDVCYEVTKRPVDAFTPTAINKPANPSSCTWIPKWQGNSDWQVVGNNLRWTVNYGTDWNIPGLQVMMAFRKNNNHSQVTYATMDVAGSTNTPPPSGYFWHESRGVFSPAPPMCSGATPVHGAPCTQPDHGCQAGGNEYRCSLGAPAPKSAAAEPTPSYAVSDVVESVTTTVTTVVTTVVDIVVDTVTNNIVDPIIEIVQTVGGLWNDLMSFE